MADKKPLYQDPEIKIEPLPSSPEDHYVTIGEENGFLLQRSILKELARTPRGGIERKLDTMDPSTLYLLREANITVDSLHVALCQAYIEEEERYQDFVRFQQD